jgi:hypothetical protein
MSLLIIAYCLLLRASEQPDKSGVMELVLAKDAVAGKPKKKLLDQVRMRCA